MDTVSTFAAILILATLAESIVEYLVKPIFLPAPPAEGDPQPVAGDEQGGGELFTIKPATRTLLLRYISALVGMLLCVAYHADLLELAGLVTTTPLVGQLITGIVIGRGANYLHDLVSQGEGAR